MTKPLWPMNRISGVMVSVLASSAVYRGFKPRSGQTKDYKKSVKISKGYSESVYRRRKDNTMAKRIYIKLVFVIANNRVLFVITYHPALSNLSNNVREHWTTIQKTPELCKIFKEPPVLAFRKPKSLKDILVRANISPRSAYNGQCQKCDSRRCMTCKNIQCTQKFSSTHTGEKFIMQCQLQDRKY